MKFFSRKKKDVSCDSCGTAFGSQDELVAHGKVHQERKEAQNDMEQNEKRSHISCSSCGSSFHSQNELQEHGQKYHSK